MKIKESVSIPPMFYTPTRYMVIVWAPNIDVFNAYLGRHTEEIYPFPQVLIIQNRGKQVMYYSSKPIQLKDVATKVSPGHVKEVIYL